MKERIKKLTEYLRHRDSPLVAFILIMTTVLFFAISYFGVSNSSICGLEKKANDFKLQNGSKIHIRYYLSEETEGKRKSVITPVNKFNDTHLKELARCVSYVKTAKYNITYGETTFETTHLVYGDIYSKILSTSHLALSKGEFLDDDFADEKTVYVTKPVIDKLGLPIDEAVGKPIYLSFDTSHEFIIKGVMGVNNLGDGGIHFKHLFSDSFIFMNSKNIYKYDFTDLFFGSNDSYFEDDFVDFEKKLEDTYLDYRQIEMRMGSIVGQDIIMTEKFNLSDVGGPLSIVITFASIIGIVVVAGFHIYLLAIYDFYKNSLLEKIIICVITCLWAFMPMIAGLLLMKHGFFMARWVIGLFIGYAALTLFVVLTKFPFFRNKDKQLEEQQAKEVAASNEQTAKAKTSSRAKSTAKSSKAKTTSKSPSPRVKKAK